MMKTRKTISKRFSKTKNNKVMHRRGGQDHFNSRESSRVTRAKRKDAVLDKSHAQTILKFI